MKCQGLFVFAVLLFCLRATAATPELCEALLAPSDAKIVHVYQQLVLRTGLQRSLISPADIDELLSASESDPEKLFELSESKNSEREILRRGLLDLKHFVLSNANDKTLIFSEIKKLLRAAGESEQRETQSIVRQLKARHSTRPLFRFLEKPFGRIRNAEFSADDQYVTTMSDDGHHIIWNVETGERVDELFDVPSVQRGSALKVGPKLILSFDEKNLKFFNAETHEWVSTLSGHKLDVSKAFATSDGKFVLSVPISESADSSIVWNTQTMQKQFSLPPFVPVTSAVILNDHSLLITTDNRGKIFTWSLKDGAKEAPFSGHRSAIVALAVTPDSRTLVSASADGTVKLWDIPSRNLMRTLVDQNHAVKYLALSPSGKYLLTDESDLRAQLWDLETLIGR